MYALILHWKIKITLKSTFQTKEKNFSFLYIFFKITYIYNFEKLFEGCENFRCSETLWGPTFEQVCQFSRISLQKIRKSHVRFRNNFFVLKMKNGVSGRVHPLWRWSPTASTPTGLSSGSVHLYFSLQNLSFITKKLLFNINRSWRGGHFHVTGLSLQVSCYLIRNNTKD